ncbi:hypothetical protein [Streptomyces sp. WAC06614]|uniref:hypothetical protein n=1 Tax=Streptomyces sp. WAC06614 TaxID=2487416 RepID=UPI0021AEB00A|nr:hypothetical protein [Streptomyces sp. WAC06614]
MKRTTRTATTTIKAVLLTAAAVAGLALTTTPAQAANCSLGGGVYICEYGVTTQNLPNGTTQQFVVGTDSAVWTRWTSTSGSWSGWQSMGGRAASKIYIHDGRFPDGDPWTFWVLYHGSDGYAHENGRKHDGNWTGWRVVDDF